MLTYWILATLITLVLMLTVWWHDGEDLTLKVFFIMCLLSIFPLTLILVLIRIAGEYSKKLVDYSRIIIIRGRSKKNEDNLYQ